MWYRNAKSLKPLTRPSLKEQKHEKDDYSLRIDNLLMGQHKVEKEIYFLFTIHKMKTERLPKRGHDELAPSKLALVNVYNKYG